MAFQTETKRYQDRYFKGNITQGMPYKIPGIISVPTTGTPPDPEPGDAVYWDDSDKMFKLPTTAALSRQAVGIICTRKYETSETYSNGDQIEVLLQGFMVIEVGAASAFWNRMQWSHDDQKWDPVADPTMTALTSTTLNAAYNTALKGAVDGALEELYQLPIRVIDLDGASADGDLVEVCVGITR